MRKYLVLSNTITSPFFTKQFVVNWNLILILNMMILPGISNSQDTLICDNGGFESNFEYYYAYDAYFNFGSSTCTPLNLSHRPSFFQLVSPPIFRWFEIVSNGTDPLTQHATVKFGNKALLLGNRYGPYNPCDPGRRVHKIVKRFKVDNTNRNFTFWYSAVLHYPDESGHIDAQPFFSVKCDVATNSNFCYDAINYPSNIFSYPTGDCYPDEEPYKSTNWACHRVYISKDHIGEIATIEISVAGCGAGLHFGYAFIDGFCEPCFESSYGSGVISFNNPSIEISCDGDSIKVNGSYTSPTINGDYTIFDDFIVPGFNIFNKSVNTTDKTFSFKIIKSDFQSPNDTCRDIIAYLKFKNSSGNFLPDVPTNAVEICFDKFVIPEAGIVIGDCNRNHPTNNVFSDDYYYVDFTISKADYRHWELERLMDDPYPDESGRYFLKTDGYGNGTYKLGPFLIQEGSWVLTLFYDGCSDTFQIIPPDYCSGCSQLSMVKISNIQCNPVTGTWSYDIIIPGPVPPNGECWRIDNGVDRQFNTTYTIDGNQMSNLECLNPTIKYYQNCNTIPSFTCDAKLDICPPKPCNNGNYESCDLEAYFDGIHCIDNGNGNYSYTVEFNVSDAPYPCCRSFTPGYLNLAEGQFSNPLGPFTEPERYFVIYSCGEVIPYTCTCPNSGCYKIFKVRKPEDCITREDLGGAIESSFLNSSNELKIIPNPLISDEWLIRSSLEKTDFEIMNPSGISIFAGTFIGSEHQIKISLPKGLYLLRYKNSNSTNSSIKFIKM